MQFASPRESDSGETNAKQCKDRGFRHIADRDSRAYRHRVSRPRGEGETPSQYEYSGGRVMIGFSDATRRQKVKLESAATAICNREAACCGTKFTPLYGEITVGRVARGR